MPSAAVVFAVKITERDTKAKTAAWFKEKVPIIVNRDGKTAFERSRTNRSEPKNIFMKEKINEEIFITRQKSPTEDLPNKQ